VPFAVLLAVPLGVFGAMLGLWLTGLTNNIYAQIGLVLLIGLAAKNAILIVEFAKMKLEQGEDAVSAAVGAAKLRLRPIIMTSFAFILGVVPLIIASGPARQRASRWASRFSAACWRRRCWPSSWCRSCSSRSIASSIASREGSRAGRRLKHDRAPYCHTAARRIARRLCRRPGLSPAGNRSARPFRRCGERRDGRKIPRTRPRWPARTGARYSPIRHCRSLIDEALTAGPDALLAAARIREAEALAGVSRAPLWPQASVSLNTSPTVRQAGDSQTSSYLGGAGISWEIDLWGRYRRASEAARAELLASEEARYGMQASLVAGVARYYFQLATLHDIYLITERGARNQAEVLRLIRRLSAAGISSAAEERQQESALATTEASLPTLRRQIAETGKCAGRADRAQSGSVAVWTRRPN
jgi:hypothetical protein